MAKITRFNGNLPAFAQSALGLERTVFGDTSQSDDLTAQFTSDFLRGWGIVGSTENPSREDFNALGYALSKTLAYLHQMGVAEWNASQEYFAGSIATQGGVLYISKSTNTNKQPSSSAVDWSPIISSSNFQALFDAAFNVKTTAFTRAALNSSSDSQFRAALSLGGLATLNSINNGDWSGTDLAIVNGGTGASTAAAAAANLGVLQAGTGTTQIRNNSQLDARYLTQNSANVTRLAGDTVMFHLTTPAMSPDSNHTLFYPFTLTEVYNVQVTIRNTGSEAVDDDIFATVRGRYLNNCVVRAERPAGGAYSGTRYIDVLVIGRG